MEIKSSVRCCWERLLDLHNNNNKKKTNKACHRMYVIYLKSINQ